MTGFEQLLVRQAVGLALKPLGGAIQRSLVRRGLGKADMRTALERLDQKGTGPVTIGLLLQQPIGLTQKHVKMVVESIEVQSIARTLIACHIVEVSVDSNNPLIGRLAHSVHRAFVDLKVTPDGDALKRYTDDLFQLLSRNAKSLSNTLLDELKDKSDSYAWSYQTLAYHQLSMTSSYLAILASAERPSNEIAKDWETAYRQVFSSKHTNIEIPDLMRRRRIEYKKLYVGTNFTAFNAPAASVIAERMKDRASVSSQTITDASFLDIVDKTVVVGDPGAGKSTASTILAMRSWGAECIPFIIVLKDVQVSKDGFDVVSTIETILALKYQCPPPKALIEKILLEGRSLVVFDGLDELLDGKTRKKVAEVVEAFASRFSHSRVLVTSRKVGYRVAQLDQKIFDEYQIGPFEDSQVRHYVENWFRLEEALEGYSLLEFVQRFMKVSDSIGDLRSNPLMLAFMCVLYRGQHYIPSKRPEVFRKCVDLLLYEWDLARGIDEPNVDMDLVESCLIKLAYAQLTERAYKSGFNEDQLRKLVLGPLMAQSLPDSRTANKVIDELLRLCRGRAWIFSDVGLTEEGDERFSFTHTSFAEYFAARHIERLCETPEEVAELLLPQVSSGRWEVLAQICIALRERNSDNGGNRLMGHMLKKAEAFMHETRIKGVLLSGIGVTEDDLAERRKAAKPDVAITEFLLRASDVAAIGELSFRTLLELLVEQFLDERSDAFMGILDPNYRHHDAAVDIFESVLMDSLDTLTSDGKKRNYDDAKAWLACHSPYLYKLPNSPRVISAQYMDLAENLNRRATTIALNSSDGVLRWHLALHLGNVPKIFRPDDYVRMFEPCGRPVSGFGPGTTVEWIIDSFISDLRPLLPNWRTATVLERIGGLQLGSILDLAMPSSSDADIAQRTPMREVARKLIGYRSPVFRGWIMVCMGLLEMLEQVSNRSRSLTLANFDMQDVFDYATMKLPADHDLLKSWINSEVTVWQSPYTSVS